MQVNDWRRYFIQFKLKNSSYSLLRKYSSYILKFFYFVNDIVPIILCNINNNFIMPFIYIYIYLLYTKISCLYNWTKICITNYKILTSSRDVDSISGCSSQRTSSNSSLRELWCKELWLDLARTIFNCFESLTASILQAWELLTAWILAQLLDIFFTWRLVSNDSPKLSIYRAQEGNLSRRFELFFFWIWN